MPKPIAVECSEVPERPMPQTHFFPDKTVFLSLNYTARHALSSQFPTTRRFPDLVKGNSPRETITKFLNEVMRYSATPARGYLHEVFLKGQLAASLEDRLIAGDAKMQSKETTITVTDLDYKELL